MAFIFIFGTMFLGDFKSISGPDKYLELPMSSSHLSRSGFFFSTSRPWGKRVPAGIRAAEGAWAAYLGAERPVGPRSRVHAKAHRREEPTREGQFFARALGPRLWSRSRAMAIRGDSVVRQAGLAARQALGHVGREPGRAWGSDVPASGKGSFLGAVFWKLRHFAIIIDK
jgi:hypothetical protein